MAENEEKVEVEEVVEDELETIDDTEDNDTTDWKAEALRARGIAKRNATRLEKLKKLSETKVEQLKPEEKVDKQGFDYAEKAFLRANDIKPSEYEFVSEVMASTGKSLDEVLEAKYFQAELKERRELQASKDALPTASKRSTQSSRDKVDYWIAKGEMPPADQVELRREYVNAKIKQEENKAKFSQNPVIG